MEAVGWEDAFMKGSPLNCCPLGNKEPHSGEKKIDGMRKPGKNKPRPLNYELTHLIFEQKKRVKQSSKYRKRT